jgi:tetratricopeptide (TPR) repeat protein
MEAPAAAEDTTSVAEELAPAAESVPASKPLATPPSQHTRQAISETPYEVMAKAREAFWLRDFELAEQQYRKLTLLEPDNPDGYGELGNMYFSQGKWEESAAAYYQAGTRLLNEGMVQEARQMVDVIRGLKGSQADDLEAQIDAVSASSP